jgi:FKBP-type peptidyl-prolyl cis-trans isomerase SlyD
MIIAKDKVVSIDYTLTNDDGEVLDTSIGAGPLSYLHGYGNIIPGLEAALLGKTAGDRFTAKIAAAEAYGERDDQLIMEVERSFFPEDEDLEAGMQFQANTEGGSLIVTIVEVGDDKVKIDGNHALAGMPLTFDVTVVEIRDAEPEELEHGHPHSAGGCGCGGCDGDCDDDCGDGCGCGCGGE